MRGQLACCAENMSLPDDASLVETDGESDAMSMRQLETVQTASSVFFRIELPIGDLGEVFSAGAEGHDRKSLPASSVVASYHETTMMIIHINPDRINAT